MQVYTAAGSISRMMAATLDTEGKIQATQIPGFKNARLQGCPHATVGL